jgi:hypothetical protein
MVRRTIIAAMTGLEKPIDYPIYKKIFFNYFTLDSSVCEYSTCLKFDYHIYTVNITSDQETVLY